MNTLPTFRKSRTALSTLLIVFAIGFAVAATSDGKTKTRRTAPKAKSGSFTPPCSLPFKGVRNPPFDDRCGIAGGSSDPAKQAESRAKNNFCAAGSQPARAITYNDLIKLQKRSANIPKKLPDRSVVKKLGEGRYVSFVAFIKNAHYSDVNAGEAVNCNIPGRTTNDIHIVLLQDLKQDECLSTTAEMSPHYRPPGWTDKKLNATTGHPVRISGQLFFDGSHSPCTATSRPNPKRASVWEIHPVYSVEVCSQTTIAACQSSTAKWTRLSEL